MLGVQQHLNDFFRELRTVLACLRIERDNVALNCDSKVSVVAKSYSVAAQYSRLLLSHSVGLVCTELARSEDVKVVDNHISGGTASSDGCTCRFHAGMPMPCRHMFSMRRGLWTTPVWWHFDRWTVDGMMHIIVPCSGGIQAQWESVWLRPMVQTWGGIHEWGHNLWRAYLQAGHYWA